MKFSCTYSYRSPHYYALLSSKVASQDTVSFVRGVLRELGFSLPDSVRVWRFAGAAKQACEKTCVIAGWALLFFMPFICVNEACFTALSDGKKRFLIARAVMKGRGMWRQVFVSLVILLTLVMLGRFIAHRFLVGMGSPLFQDTDMLGMLIGAVIASIILVRRSRAFELALDRRAASFHGDIESAIEAVELQRQHFDERYPRTTLKGRLVQFFCRLFRPFNLTPSTEIRLRSLRELAREQKDMA